MIKMMRRGCWFGQCCCNWWQNHTLWCWNGKAFLALQGHPTALLRFARHSGAGGLFFKGEINATSETLMFQVIRWPCKVITTALLRFSRRDGAEELFLKEINAAWSCHTNWYLKANTRHAKSHQWYSQTGRQALRSFFCLKKKRKKKSELSLQG